MMQIVAPLPVTQARVFVVCPGGLVTGGPELLHQLVHALREEGRDASIAYHPFRPGWKTPEPYLRYRCPVVENVPDQDDCAIVVPEVQTRLLRSFLRARHVVWWLSVDYYSGTPGSIDGWRTLLRRLFVRDIPSPTATAHLFQSAYARDYVRRRLGCAGFMLSDYIPDDFFQPGMARSRRDAVAFNPKKGLAFTRRFMRAHPDIECVPLRGLTRTGMRETLDACKAYIDFGAHPGKDRIPREAALRGAVVFVGRRGSAVNAEDVPIDPFFKVESGRPGVAELGRRLRQVFADHDRHSRSQNAYRSVIAAEVEAFRAQMRIAFDCTPRAPRSGDGRA